MISALGCASAVNGVTRGSNKTSVVSTASSSVAVERPLLNSRAPKRRLASHKQLQQTTLRQSRITLSRTLANSSGEIKHKLQGTSRSNIPRIVHNRKHNIIRSNSEDLANANVTVVPENNSLDEIIRRKPQRVSKRRPRHRKHSRSHVRKLVTKERREFWDRLDQRERIRNRRQNDNIKTDRRRNISIGIEENRTTTESTMLDEKLLQDFPYLDEHYDYNYYYYDDMPTSLSEGSMIPSTSESVQVKGAQTSVIINKLSSAQNTNITKTQINNAHNDKINDIPQSSNMTSISQAKESLSKKLLNNLILIPRLQARIMPKLTAEETRQFRSFSAAPVPNPMTAIDSFRNRRQNGNDDINKPRDILKEFPIFRHFKSRDETNSETRKTISLHERLQSHLTSTLGSNSSALHTGTSLKATSPNILSTTETSITTVETITIFNAELSVTTNTEKNDQIVLDYSPGENQNQTEDSAIELIPVTEILTKEENKILSIENTTENVLLKSYLEPSSPNSTKGVESIKTNVTFSTSKTQRAIESSPSAIIDKAVLQYQQAIENSPLAIMDKAVLQSQQATENSPLAKIDKAVLQSQLGVAPLGDSPFGISPFGESPMGEKPFGLIPEGVSPLGNHTLVPIHSDGSDPELPQDGADGRYHVQVTGPDGSINGDYIVVDPVTGDLNGVRYEVAQDVDPLLVQKALLNFLSLDPRLSPESLFNHSPIADADTSVLSGDSPSEEPPTSDVVNETEQPITSG